MSLSSQSKRQGEGSPVSRKSLESASKSKLNSVQMPDKDQDSQEPDTESQDTQESQPPANEPFPPESVYEYSLIYSVISSEVFGNKWDVYSVVLYPHLKGFAFLPSSAPPKAEAFEDFKVGQGSKINRILKENKAVLLERRSLLRQLTEEVNAVKREIDCTTATIQQRRELREDQGTPNVCILKRSGR